MGLTAVVPFALRLLSGCRRCASTKSFSCGRRARRALGPMAATSCRRHSRGRATTWCRTCIGRPSPSIYQRSTPACRWLWFPAAGIVELWTDHEGHNEARFLNEKRGIAAFVLQYRLARENELHVHHRRRRPGRPQARHPHGAFASGMVAGHDENWRHGVLRGRTTRGAGRYVGRLGRRRRRRMSSIAHRQSSTSRRSCIRASGPELQINASTPPMRLLCGSDDRPEVIAGITNIYLKLREASGTCISTMAFRMASACAQPDRPGVSLAANLRQTG